MNNVYNGNRNLERTLENLDSKNITRKNKKLIKEFISFLAVNGVGKLRQEKYIYGPQQIAEWLGMDFDRAIKKDTQRICVILENKEYVILTCFHLVAI